LSVLPLISSGIGVGGTQVFGDNFAQLQQLKKKYDPNNVFSKGPQFGIS
jgi:FAD/FMN-containing dehydrogenase